MNKPKFIKYIKISEKVLENTRNSTSVLPILPMKIPHKISHVVTSSAS